MADSSRIEDLRRRVQKDPASIAFAQLAEECRRAGNLEEAVEVCRAGLQIHPGYLSARVTLGRALVEMNDLDSAIGELEHVLRGAPENLAAIRGLAEIHHRQGNLEKALKQYRAALALARNDPDLQQTVDELTHQLEPPVPEVAESDPPDAPAEAAAGPAEAGHYISETAAAPAATSYYGTDPVEPAAGPAEAEHHTSETAAQVHEPVAVSSYWDTLSAPVTPAAVDTLDLAPAVALVAERDDDPAAREQAVQMIAVLQQWLDAIHVTRAQPHA